MFWIVRLSGIRDRISDEVKLSPTSKNKNKKRDIIITSADKNLSKDQINKTNNGQVGYHSIPTYKFPYISLNIALDTTVFNSWWLWQWRTNIKSIFNEKRTRIWVKRHYNAGTKKLFKSSFNRSNTVSTMPQFARWVSSASFRCKSYQHWLFQCGCSCEEAI